MKPETAQEVNNVSHNNSLGAKTVCGLHPTGEEAHPVLRAAADACDISLEQLCSEQQTRRVALARHIACQILTDDGVSASEVGRIVGRDHNTVSSALRRIHGLVERNAYGASDKLKRARTILGRAP